MTNAQIADNFSLLSKLITIHGDDDFKAKTYSIAAFTIEKLTVELSTLNINQMLAIKGIGKTVAQKIVEQIETQQFALLQQYLQQTPQGILDILQNIKGVGPKKIAIIWKEMEIETVADLLYACTENRLSRYKGFGEKSQAAIQQAIEFYYSTLGSYLWVQVQPLAAAITQALTQQFKQNQTAQVGGIAMQADVLDKIEWVTTVDPAQLIQFFTANGYNLTQQLDEKICFTAPQTILLCFYPCTTKTFGSTAFKHNCSKEFYDAWQQQFAAKEVEVEQQIFDSASISYLPAYRRYNPAYIQLAIQNKLPQPITAQSIKGIIHCHSNWSDGTHTIEQMAEAAQQKGFEYIVITDHSKTAFYAQGLSVDKVLAQHQLIDELNAKFSNFKIFKGIESDILNDGNLDYEEDVLKTFDVVIASVHANLNMPEDKAMQRLIKAIENKYTTILGHATGRLLLGRNGYPINHTLIIDACAANHVAIELNAHPRRLDIDWRYIDYALQKNVPISINPDAHEIAGFDDIAYGVICAQKSLLTPAQNLSSFSLQQFEQYLQTK